MTAPRTPEEWKAWRRTVREPWVRKAEDVDLLTAFGLAETSVTLKRAGSEHVGPCPLCGGLRDKFAIHPSRGKWYCRGIGGGGTSPVGMVMHITGLPFLEVPKLLTGEPDPGRPDAPPISAEEKARREKEWAERQAANAAAVAAREAEERDYRAEEQRRAREIFEAAVPWLGTPVEAYLRWRRLIDDATLPALRGLRLRYIERDYLEPEKDDRGRLTFVNCGRFGFMVAGLVRDGALVGVHLTPLDPAFLVGGTPATAKGKAQPIHPVTGELLPAKKMRGSSRGCCIRLFGPPAPDVLIRGEGIETTIGFVAGLVRTGRLTPAMAAWAAGSLDNLGGPHDGMVAHPTRKTDKGRAVRVKGPVPRPADAAHPVMAVPGSVRRMIDLADGDSDRFEVEQVLTRSRSRWQEPGRAVVAVWPPAGLDWAQATGGV